MGNDKYGDCTCAAAGHMIQEWTANVGDAVTPSTDDIIAAYKHFVGNKTDNGVSMLDFLIYWRAVGIDNDTIMAFAQLELRNSILVQDSIYLFGSCYIGVSLPDFACGDDVPDPLAVPWELPPQGAVGDAAPNPQKGHCIPAVGYDQRNLYVVTWGALKVMSWPFYHAYADEAYAVLSEDWISKTLGTAPQGLDLATLKNDLGLVTS